MKHEAGRDVSLGKCDVCYGRSSGGPTCGVTRSLMMSRIKKIPGGCLSCGFRKAEEGNQEILHIRLTIRYLSSPSWPVNNVPLLELSEHLKDPYDDEMCSPTDEMRTKKMVLSVQYQA